MTQSVTSNCYGCGADLTQHSSSEHIIPQAIGGRLASMGLLCIQCNSKFGDSIDAELSKDMATFVALLSLQRQRSKDVPVLRNVSSNDGQIYNLVDGRKPIPHKPVVDITNGHLHIEARDEKELAEILKGLKRKYPNLDLDDVKRNVRRSTEYMSAGLNLGFELGGEMQLRAVAKIAVNYYLHLGGDRTLLSELIAIIKGEQANDKHVHIYPLPSNISWEEGEVSHLVTLCGDPDRKLLIAQIVLFSSFSYVVTLNEAYDGPVIEKTYCYDVLQRKEIRKLPRLTYAGRSFFKNKFNTQQSQALFNANSLAAYQRDMSRVLSIADQIQTDAAIRDIKARAWTEMLQRYPNGVPKTERATVEFCKLLEEKIAPLLAHLQRKRGV